MNEVFLLMGSNRGDRENFMGLALEMIEKMAGRVCAKSFLYETDPWGFDDPVPFLNQVVEVDTSLTPQELLDQLLTIEVRLGRIRPFDGCGCSVPSVASAVKEPGNEAAPVYSGRTIDLDILFYGQRLVFSDSLMIPHPRLHERKFTLIPLEEIAPLFIHPVLKRTVSALLRECRDQSKVLKFSKQDLRF
ncbi:MAG: 2-amino-4-hydroxy-6-hydroxymethyldihydropteridine diphosphokinase [bacterium]